MNDNFIDEELKTNHYLIMQQHNLNKNPQILKKGIEYDNDRYKQTPALHHMVDFSTLLLENVDVINKFPGVIYTINKKRLLTIEYSMLYSEDLRYTMESARYTYPLIDWDKTTGVFVGKRQKETTPAIVRTMDFIELMIGLEDDRYYLLAVIACSRLCSFVEMRHAEINRMTNYMFQLHYWTINKLINILEIVQPKPLFNTIMQKAITWMVLHLKFMQNDQYYIGLKTEGLNEMEFRTLQKMFSNFILHYTTKNQLKYDELQTAYKDMTKQLATLQTSLVVNPTIQNAKVAELTAKNAELTAKNAELVDEINKITNRTTTLTNQNITLTNQNTTLTNQTNELQYKLEHSERKFTTLQISFKEILDLNQELYIQNRKLQEQIGKNDTDTYTTDLNSQLMESYKIRADLTNELECSKQYRVELENKISQLTNQQTELQTQNKTLTEKYEHSVDDSFNFNNKVIQLYADINKLCRERDCEKQRCIDLESEIVNQKIKIAEQKTQIEELTTKNTALTTRQTNNAVEPNLHTTYATIINNLQDALCATKMQLADAKEQIAKDAEQHAKDAERHAKALELDQQRTLSQTKKLELYPIIISNQQEQLKAVKAELQEAKAELQAVNAELQAVKTELQAVKAALNNDDLDMDMLRFRI